MAIDTDNLVKDFIVNLKAIFDDHMTSLNLKEVFTEDVLLIPVTPCLALSCISFFNQVLTIGRVNTRYQFNFIAEAWYYHQAITEEVYRNLVMTSAYKISEHIMKNSTLNGWLNGKQAVVRSCSYTPRLRSGSLYACARIVIFAPYQTRITST